LFARAFCENKNRIPSLHSSLAAGSSIEILALVGTQESAHIMCSTIHHHHHRSSSSSSSRSLHDSSSFIDSIPSHRDMIFAWKTSKCSALSEQCVEQSVASDPTMTAPSPFIAHGTTANGLLAVTASLSLSGSGRTSVPHQAAVALVVHRCESSALRAPPQMTAAAASEATTQSLSAVDMADAATVYQTTVASSDRSASDLENDEGSSEEEVVADLVEEQSERPVQMRHSISSSSIVQVMPSSGGGGGNNQMAAPSTGKSARETTVRDTADGLPRPENVQDVPPSSLVSNRSSPTTSRQASPVGSLEKSKQKTNKKSRRTTTGSCPTSRKSGNASSSSRAGRWTPQEHATFLNSWALHGRDWTRVAQDIPTRTATQVRSHAQKFFQSAVVSETPGQGSMAENEPSAKRQCSTKSRTTRSRPKSASTATALTSRGAHKGRTVRDLTHPSLTSRWIASPVEETLNHFRGQYQSLMVDHSVDDAYDDRDDDSDSDIEYFHEQCSEDAMPACDNICMVVTSHEEDLWASLNNEERTALCILRLMRQHPLGTLRDFHNHVDAMATPAATAPFESQRKRRSISE
jgi:SHAQKYF class myb-like DNA-binding protein